MPSPHPTVTAGAASHRHVELPVDRPARNLHLILPIDVGRNHPPAATRTTRGQRRFVNFVDDRRHGPERLGSVILAALASRPLGRKPGQTPRKRRRLTLGRAA